MAQDRDIQSGDAPAKAPISAHPAFPVLVGLWFAALFGIGTMVMPAAVIENAVGATGLLGEGALILESRLVLASLVAVLGLYGGLVLARRIAERQSASRSPRLLSVNDDLGAEPIALPAKSQRKPLPGRRRSLAVADERPLEDVPLVAPVPGSDIALSVEPGTGDSLASSISVVPHESYMSAQELSAPSAGVFGDLVVAPERERPQRAKPQKPKGIDAPLDELGIVQLVERLGYSMQRRLGQAKLSNSEAIHDRALFTGATSRRRDHTEEVAQTMPGESSPLDAPCQPFGSTEATLREGANHVETDRALRSVLANLQRISGTA